MIEPKHTNWASKLGGSYYTQDRIEKKKSKILSKLDGIFLLVTTLSREEYNLDRVFTLFKEQHYIERENHILKGTLRIRPVYLQNQKRIEGLIFILWLALLCYLLMERIYRNNSSEPKEKKRTVRSILERLMYIYIVVLWDIRLLFQILWMSGRSGYIPDWN